MLWIFGAFFFAWLAFREIRGAYQSFQPSPFDPIYLAIVVVLSLACAWQPVSQWRFEQFLSAKASLLADGRKATVHCNSFFDTVIDPNVMAVGHANFETGEIVLQYLWCDKLRGFINHPERASIDEIYSLNLFTHEAMHVRGERDEARTECQAVQRNVRSAKLLGVPDEIAKQSALRYYEGDYKKKGEIGGMAGSYFSTECAPGKALDERLPDSTWAQ